MLAGDHGLAYGLLPEAQHAAVSPHLVDKGLKHHPFLHVALLLLLLLRRLLRIHGLLCLSLHSRTHPPLAPTAPPWALASSRTHAQCGGGSSWRALLIHRGMVAVSHIEAAGCELFQVCRSFVLLEIPLVEKKKKGQEGGNRREKNKKWI